MGQLQGLGHPACSTDLLVLSARSVVRHHHFEIPVGQSGQATQYRQQRITAVVGGDDHGYQGEAGILN